MAARRARHEHSQYADGMLNANTSLSGAGSAVEPAPGMDNLPDLDLNSPLGLLDMSPGSPRTVPSIQDFSFSSYHTDSFVSSSATLPGYQISSHPKSGLQHFTDQIQSAGVLSGSNQPDPWNPLPVTGTPQELPIHPKSGGVPAVRTPVRRSDTSTLPPDSGYRSASQYETQSHLSAPDMHTSTEMDAYMMSRQQADFTGLASPFQEHTETQHFEINSLAPQDIIQEQHFEHPPRHELKCRVCGCESKTPSDAKKHANRHTKPNVCHEPGCARSEVGFATPNDLIRHVKSVHTRGGKIWKCMAPGCNKPDKPWPRLDNFKQHLVRMHPDSDADELVRLAEARPDFSSGDDEALTVINNVLHQQEDKIRRERRRQSRRRTSTSTFTSTGSRQKRPAEDLPSTPPESQRARPSAPTLNTDPHFNRTPTQNMRFLSPHSPNVPQYGTTHLFGRNITTSSQNRRRRPQAPQRQSDPQQLVAQGMARSLSQQEPTSRRHTFGNGQQPPNSLQQYNPMASNFLPTQPVHLSADDVRSAYEHQWNLQQQFPTHQYPHTVAGDNNWEWMQTQNDSMFAYPSYSTADLPHHSVLLGDLAGPMQPASQKASASPTITGNDPPTPPSQTQTPTVMFSLEQDRPPPDDIADISKILQGLGNYKLFQAIGNNPGAQEELSRMFQFAKGSSCATVKSEASYMESPSQGISKSQHQRQISSSSDAVSAPNASHQATKSATAAAAKRSAANKPNAVCPRCEKEVGRQSDLKKHMKRHTRPYGCVLDGCNKVFGSKNDWKRHELTHGEPEGGWHCDGHHTGQHGDGCQAWWPIGSSTFEDSRAHYISHLRVCGVAPQDLADVLQQCFIPKGWKKGAFWCGFCECVVHLTGEEETYIEQRFSHIETHYMKEEPKRNNTQWKDCNGGGASKGNEPGAAPGTSDRGGASQQ